MIKWGIVKIDLLFQNLIKQNPMSTEHMEELNDQQIVRREK